MVVEDKDFVFGADGKPVYSQPPGTLPVAKAQDKIVKPIIVPTGVSKSIGISASAVKAAPPKPIVIPTSSGVKP